jgi:hypothetical protein
MSGWVGLRAEGRRISDSRSSLEEFFRRFCLGRFEDAAKLCADPLSWYGVILRRSQWVKEIEAAQREAVPMQSGGARSIPIESLASLDLARRARFC